MARIGLVGLGRMGRAIQARLKASGFDVIGWDRDAVAMKAAADNGMEGAGHPPPGRDGFLSGDARGKLFIEMSTLQPMTGREFAPLVEAAGARLIDSPVLGTIA